jgi:hypothetical protein
MESRLGYQFDHIRVHADSAADSAAEAQGARAYAAGAHLVFRRGAFAPHTAAGLRLLGHELAHSVQQGGESWRPGGSGTDEASNPQAEREARAAGFGLLEPGTLTVSPNSLAEIGMDKSRSDASAGPAQDIIAEILTPTLYKDAVIKKVIAGSPEVSVRVVQALGQRTLEKVAGSNEGTEILNVMVSKLAGTPEGATLTAALSARSNVPGVGIPEAKGKPEDIQAIARINRVLPLDPRFGDYTRAGVADVPLKFPVELYSPGRPIDGGVYYDPNLDKSGRVDVEGHKIGLARTQYPLFYIKLGPAAVSSSDAYLQSVLWHEFVHFRRVLGFRRPDAEKSDQTKQLEVAVGAGPEALDADAEVEATSFQLAVYLEKLPDDDVKGVLGYLAKFLPSALPPFKPAAIQRIRDAVAGKPAQRRRLLHLIDDTKDRKRRSALAPLRNAL